MRHLLIALVIPLAACSKSPTSPTTGESSNMLAGRAVNALDGAAVAGVSVRVGSNVAVTTDAAGLFQVEIDTAGTYAANLRGGAFVERQTSVTGPGSGVAQLSMIPASFDMESFDQMFRTSHDRLQRWTSQPHLVVLASVMNYRGATSNDEYSASSEQLTEAEVTQMVAHMTEGLSLLTGGTYTSFASVEIERPGSGERVRVAREGRVVVGRYNGIVTFAQTIGYGGWAEQEDGTITGGAMFLDRDFDKDDDRRRLLRIHELGHALGYQHVTARTSIMNPSIGPEPTENDLAGARIAFQRPPGNHAPDIDPGSTPRTFLTTGGSARWVTTYCR
jgi:hypothetical protein